MISRKRLYRANQIALKHYRSIFWWNSYVHGKTEYQHDYWGKDKALPINDALFGVYRKTRAFKRLNWGCSCFYCTMERPYGRQLIQSNINFREQLKEENVI